MIGLLALTFLVGGAAVIRRGYPLPGFVLASAGAWLGIVWMVQL